MAKPIELLLVEDNPGDADLTREALEEGRVVNRLSVVPDGLEALAYLRRTGKYENARRPDLILLDLNMPRMDGRELLAELKKDRHLKNIPMIVLTTSDAEKDVLAAYELHANAYIVKPVDLTQFMAAVRSIETFWFHIVKLPPAERG